MCYCSTLLSNHGRIRLKRFVSQITRNLCNYLFFSLYLILHAYIQTSDVIGCKILRWKLNKAWLHISRKILLFVVFYIFNKSLLDTSYVTNKQTKLKKKRMYDIWIWKISTAVIFQKNNKKKKNSRMTSHIRIAPTWRTRKKRKPAPYRQHSQQRRWRR
jgi:hypothetical protein